MHKILVPFDFSEQAGYAYDMATRIATKCNAEIHILGIVVAPTNAEFDSHGHLKTDTGFDYSHLFQEQIELQKKLEDWAKDQSLVAGISTKIGHFKKAIQRYVEDHSIDLVVLGIRDLHGVEDKLIDSFAAKVVRYSSVPVLTLKCDRSDYELTDLLFVNDFTKPEKMDLSFIRTLLDCLGLQMHFLLVSTPRHFVTTLEGRAHMEAFAEMNGLKNVRYHVYCDRSIEDGIANFSAETGIDFVAIGTHQSTGIRRILRNGSRAEEVVNHLWLPILTFKI